MIINVFFIVNTAKDIIINKNIENKIIFMKINYIYIYI